MCIYNSGIRRRTSINVCNQFVPVAYRYIMQSWNSQRRRTESLMDVASHQVSLASTMFLSPLAPPLHPLPPFSPPPPPSPPPPADTADDDATETPDNLGERGAWVEWELDLSLSSFAPHTSTETRTKVLIIKEGGGNEKLPWLFFYLHAFPPFFGRGRKEQASSRARPFPSFFRGTINKAVK